MTDVSRAAAIAIWLGSGALAGCSQKPAPPASSPPAASAAPAVATPATAPRPARHAHMVCRSSRDGRPVPCGTPDAVMVGIKED